MTKEDGVMDNDYFADLYAFQDKINETLRKQIAETEWYQPGLFLEEKKNLSVEEISVLVPLPDPVAVAEFYANRPKPTRLQRLVWWEAKTTYRVRHRIASWIIGYDIDDAIDDSRY